MNAEFGSTGENDRTGDDDGRGGSWRVLSGLFVLALVIAALIIFL
jgi:hypothetical protein